MNAKKCFLTVTVLSAVILAIAASFRPLKRGINEHERTALSGLSGKFGPVIETTLPTVKTKGDNDILNILDLETGRASLQPPVEDADATMAWIRSNHVDISCSVWSDGAACVTYNMVVVAGEGKCWEATTEQELLANPVLALGQRAPRRLLFLGPDRPDTYLFRTGEGNLGMLQTIGLSQDGQGVKIRYKLLNPARSESSIVSATEARPKRDF